MYEDLDPEQVTDKASLVRFVVALSEARAADEPGWDNRDLATYLEAMSGWIGDSDGYYRNRGEEPPGRPTWSFVAVMLLAASAYE